jgi:hypothetical protein
VATCTATSLSAGTHSITAAYKGDSDYGASTGNLSLTVGKATATTSLSASPGTTSVVDGSVTFTETVSAPSGATVNPTGTVSFTDNGTTITNCNSVTITSGAAQCTTTALTEGSHTIVATYSGDTNYNKANNNLDQSVTAASSSTQLTAIPNPSSVNQSVTFTATVSPSTSSVPLSGTVSFTDNGSAIGCAVQWSASKGVATCSTSTLTKGSHTIVATYAGDVNYSTSSASLSQVVGQASTSTALTASPNPSTINQSVQFSAKVTYPSGTTGLSGTVSFTDNGKLITSCSAVTPSTLGVAVCNDATLTLGTHSIVASYGNDANFGSSTSNAVSQVVNPGTTSIALLSSAGSSIVDQSVTFTATVTGASGSTTYSGTMTFTDNGNAICSVPVNTTTGVATCTDTKLTAGSHSIEASYGGDSNFATSNSTVTQIVGQAATSLALTSSANPSIITTPVTLTATVTPFSVPVLLSGSVTFMDGSSPVAGCSSAVAINSATGQASCTTTALTVGPHSITATYTADPNYKSSSSSVSQAVEDFSVTASSSVVTITQGYTNVNDPFTPQTLTISPNSPSGFSGDVSITCTVAADPAPVAPSGATPPTCTPSITTAPVSSGGTQTTVSIVVDATKASAGIYTYTITGTDQTNNLQRSASVTVMVRDKTSALTLVSGANTGNTIPTSFVLPPNVSFSSLQCVTVAGTGLPPLGLSPSTISLGCSFNPGSVPSQTSLQTAQVTVTVSTGSSTTTAGIPGHSKVLAAGLLGLPIFGLFGLLGGRKSARSFFRLMAVLAFIVATYQLTGCGGSFQKPMSAGGKTPPGTYNLLVQGTGSNGQTYQAVITLNITL